MNVKTDGINYPIITPIMGFTQEAIPGEEKRVRFAEGTTGVDANHAPLAKEARPVLKTGVQKRSIQEVATAAIDLLNNFSSEES